MWFIQAKEDSQIGIILATLDDYNLVEAMRSGGAIDASTSTVEKKAIHQVIMHPVKINVTKFDSKKNFGMWRYKVIDALYSLNLEYVMDDDEHIEEIVLR